MNYQEPYLRTEHTLPSPEAPAGKATEFTVGELRCGIACEDPQPAVVVDRLTVGYNGVNVLRNVSTSIQKGCITALIGPSGCGKTTFLNCLNRLIDLVPSSHTQGSIHIDGIDIRSKSVDVRTLRRKVGMVFQRPNPFPFSIWRNLELTLREHGLKSHSEIQGRVEQALKDVGLWAEVSHKLKHSALSLSGGQQQRLCIARALLLEPEIILMDEPCSALDPMSSAIVEDLILQMKNRYTVMIVTHNLAQSRRIANYVAFFWVVDSVGALIEFGECCQIFGAPENPITADYIYGMRG
jgi:phosphate transport system ATP-binding protein